MLFFDVLLLLILVIKGLWNNSFVVVVEIVDILNVCL